MNCPRCQHEHLPTMKLEALGFGQRAQAFAEPLGEVPHQVTGNLHLGIAYLLTGDYRQADGPF